MPDAPPDPTLDGQLTPGRLPDESELTARLLRHVEPSAFYRACWRFKPFRSSWVGAAQLFVVPLLVATVFSLGPPDPEAGPVPWVLGVAAAPRFSMLAGVASARPGVLAWAAVFFTAMAVLAGIGARQVAIGVERRMGVARVRFFTRTLLKGMIDVTRTTDLALDGVHREVHRLRDLSRQVQSRIHLVSPAAAVDPVGDICAHCAAVAEDAYRVVGWHRVARLETAIRATLIGLLRVLRRWERFEDRVEGYTGGGLTRADEAVYRATVLLLRPPDGTAPRFWSPTFDAAGAEGLLVLEPGLSVRLHGDRALRDREADGAPPFAIWAPSEAHARRWPDRRARPPRSGAFDCLPGPAVAYARREAHTLSDARDLTAWSRKHSTVPQGVAEDAEAYYRDRDVRSLVSMFLSESLRVDVADLREGRRIVRIGDRQRVEIEIPPEYLYRPLGVVTCASSHPDLLANDAILELYVDSARPLRLLLGRLLTDYTRERHATP